MLIVKNGIYRDVQNPEAYFKKGYEPIKTAPKKRGRPKKSDS